MTSATVGIGLFGIRHLDEDHWVRQLDFVNQSLNITSLRSYYVEKAYNFKKPFN